MIYRPTEVEAPGQAGALDLVSAAADLSEPRFVPEVGSDVDAAPQSKTPRCRMCPAARCEVFVPGPEGLASGSALGLERADLHVELVRDANQFLLRSVLLGGALLARQVLFHGRLERIDGLLGGHHLVHR